jgi:hypothetical protein
LSPSGLAARALRTRAFVRAPIALYRHQLGWLLGGRMLMLEHTGRRSGRSTSTRMPRLLAVRIISTKSPSVPNPRVDRVVVGNVIAVIAQR